MPLFMTFMTAPPVCLSAFYYTASAAIDLDHILTILRRILTVMVRVGPLVAVGVVSLERLCGGRKRTVIVISLELWYYTSMHAHARMEKDAL
jgi:hypothetical protein